MATDLTPAIPEGRQIVESYGAGRFLVSGTTHAGSIIVFPEQTLAWPVAGVAGLPMDSLVPVLEADPPVEVLLLGCGVRMEMLDPALKAALRERGIGCDAMDTGAACRTYNVLMAESRRVAAALIALPE
jgi:uncharacterized protein